MARMVLQARTSSRLASKPAVDYSATGKKKTKTAVPPPAPLPVVESEEEEEEESSSEEEEEEDEEEDEEDAEKRRLYAARSRSRRFGSKLEVKRSIKIRGKELKTASGLKSDDLERKPILDAKGNQKYITVTDKEGNEKQIPRFRIVYKSRQVVGQLIERYTHEEITGGMKEVKERMQEVKEYFSRYPDEIAKKKLENSKMYQTYQSIKKPSDITAHNQHVQLLADQWEETNKKQRSYFSPVGKPKGWKKPLNFKKPRSRGHFSTSGKSGRRCIKSGASTEDCAKEACDDKDHKKIFNDKNPGPARLNQGGKKYCASPSKKIQKGREAAAAAAVADD